MFRGFLLDGVQCGIVYSVPNGAVSGQCRGNDMLVLLGWAFFQQDQLHGLYTVCSG